MSGPDPTRSLFRLGPSAPAAPDMYRTIAPELQSRLDALAHTVASMETSTFSAACAALDSCLVETSTLARSAAIRDEWHEPQPSGHVSIQGAARTLGLSERTLRRWIAAGKLATVKRNRRAFIDLARAFQLREIARHEIDTESRPG